MVVQRVIVDKQLRGPRGAEGARGAPGPPGGDSSMFHTPWQHDAEGWPHDDSQAIADCIDAAIADNNAPVWFNGKFGFDGDLLLLAGPTYYGTSIPAYPIPEAVEGNLIALGSTARVRYGQFGGGSSANDNPGALRDCTINGNYLADELFRMECVDGFIENCHIIRAAPGGKTFEVSASQNSTVLGGVIGYSPDATALSIYMNPGQGAGSTRFVDVYIATSGILLDADADAANFSPHDVSFTHCLFENYTAGNELLQLKAGEFQFRNCVITNSNSGASPANDCLVLLENDTWPTLSTTATFDSCYFNGGTADVTDLIRVKNSNSATHVGNRVTFYGRTHFSHGDNIVCIDGGGLSNSGIVQVNGELRLVSGTLNKWRAINAGTYASLMTKTPMPTRIEVPVDGTGTQLAAHTYRVEGDTADRIRVDPANFAISLFDGVSGVTPKGVISYSLANDYSSFGRLWQFANAISLRPIAFSVTTAAQAVALSAASTAAPLYYIGFAANSATADVTLSGGTLGSLIYVVLDNRSSFTGVSVSWPSNIKWLTETPQPIAGKARVIALLNYDGTDFHEISKGTDVALAALVATKADLASPALTGNPTAPTPSAGDNDTSVATTAFVHSEAVVKVQGTTATAIGTAAKTATISGYTPAAGDVLQLTLTNGNSAAAPTLNINSGGAKAIFLGGFAMTVSNGITLAGGVWMLIYDGTQWHITGVPANYSQPSQAQMEAASLTTVGWMSPANILQTVNAQSGSPTSTTAALAAIGNAVNTANKRAGKQYFNATTSKPVWAAGATAGSVWVDATGATVHTPV